jgi:hypothetical protein
MTQPDLEALVGREDDADTIAASLTQEERDLLLGNPNGWGSWMWSCACGMIGKGIARRTAAGIDFDTDLARNVRARLRTDPAS